MNNFAYFFLQLGLLTILQVHVSISQQQASLSGILSPSNLLFIGDTNYGKQFYSQNVLLNFTQAETYCAQHTLRIASVDTKEEGVMIGKWATTLNYQDYTLPSYTLGSGAVPFQSRNCIEASSVNQSTWFSSSCEGLGHPLCVTNYTRPIMALPLPSSQVNYGTAPSLNDLTFIGNSTVGLVHKQFYGYRSPSNWRKAYEVCKVRGLQLASIDADEDQFVLIRWSVTAETAAWSSFWTAGTDMFTGRWIWVTNGEDVPLEGSLDRFQWWADGQPRVGLVGQNCLTTFLSSDRVWYAAPCWQGRPTLCMKVS